MEIKKYAGILKEHKMEPLARRAYRVWQNQNTRCSNPKRREWMNYGGKGVRVEYSSRDFIGWYLANIVRFNEAEKVHVGRIDHDKNYAFNNIEMITAVENIKERNDRIWWTTNKRTIKTTCIAPSGLQIVTNSILMASKMTGINTGSIVAILNGRQKSQHGWKFMRAES